MSRDEFSVGLLLGVAEVQEWFITAIDNMVGSTTASLDRVVLTTAPADAATKDRSSAVETLTAPLRRVVRNALIGDPQTYAHVDEVELMTGYEQVALERMEGSSRVHLPEDMISSLDQSCDVLIHHGVGILGTEALKTTEHGVIGFHHGNLREYRGGPPGFWEFMHGRSQACVTVQRLADRLDAGEILVERQVDISDAMSWSEVRRRLYVNSHDLLAIALQRIQNPSFTPRQLSQEELGPVYAGSDRTRPVMARYLCKEVAGRMLPSWSDF